MAIIANVISVVHAAIAMFAVVGAGAIWIGTICHWRWTGNLFFRATHFAVVTFVMLRLTLGMPCPLSVWEDSLRGGRSTGVVARLAFRGADPERFLVGCEILFGTTVVLALHDVFKRRQHLNLSSNRRRLAQESKWPAATRNAEIRG
jgi:hypothetical protein